MSDSKTSVIFLVNFLS
ncbi:Protein of unknown function [Lactobacillus helveticus CIRM-BIA 104]|uniref:Uncharacterized protein n=1 Tax=Lactobacillus helveticus CIRM-BIA 104 TaxID=1226333 RepID=U6F954_LACHE|nr:Protein of unknown function [Lactobacillus helveticus CIRM-BIA 104]CDI62787.1 Protein of unknown function [Lactobacillus helveticus CIRM-BIA 103]